MYIYDSSVLSTEMNDADPVPQNLRRFWHTFQLLTYSYLAVSQSVPAFGWSKVEVNVVEVREAEIQDNTSPNLLG